MRRTAICSHTLHSMHDIAALQAIVISVIGKHCVGADQPHANALQPGERVSTVAKRKIIGCMNRCWAGPACALSTTKPFAQMFSFMMMTPSGLMPDFKRSKYASASSVCHTRMNLSCLLLLLLPGGMLKANCDASAPSVRYSSAHCIQTKSYLRTHPI